VERTFLYRGPPASRCSGSQRELGRLARHVTRSGTFNRATLRTMVAFSAPSPAAIRCEAQSCGGLERTTRRRALHTGPIREPAGETLCHPRERFVLEWTEGFSCSRGPKHPAPLTLKMTHMPGPPGLAPRVIPKVMGNHRQTVFPSKPLLQSGLAPKLAFSNRACGGRVVHGTARDSHPQTYTSATLPA
jgi:hypothetical protein